MRRLMYWPIFAVMIGLTAAGAKAGTEFSTDRLGYSGAVSRYATMQDAVDAVNAIGVFTLPARVTANPFNTTSRDLRLYFSNGVLSQADFNKFQMAFFYTTEANTNGKPKDDPAGNNLYSGLNNPNRTQVGRIQMFDNDGNTDTFFHAAWGGFNGSTYDSLHLRVVGADATGEDISVGGDIARVWDGTTTVNTSSALFGTMISYDLDVTLTGLAGALNNATQMISSTNHPTGAAGTFKGVFQNTNTVDPSHNGFYGFNLSLNMDNWAFGQGNAALNGNFFGSTFSSDAAPTGPSEPPAPEPTPIIIPAPGALPMAALLLAGLASFHRGRRQS